MARVVLRIRKFYLNSLPLPAMLRHPPVRYYATKSNSADKRSKIRNVLVKKLRKLEKVAPKLATKVKAFEATQWHEKAQAVKKQEETSANKSFRSVVPDKSIEAYIEKLQLGLRRRKRLSKAERAKLLKKGKPDLPFANTAADRFFESHKLRFLSSAFTVDQFPNSSLPEVAFVGRSNVGKSSLLNAVGNSTIARTSDKPGLTQTINWYSVGNKLCLVDLPGYGFAYAGEDKAKRWRELIQGYISQRDQLKRCLLLVDSRHNLKKSDREMIQFFDSIKAPYQLVMTKSDVVLPSDLAKRATLLKQELESSFKSAIPNIIIVSAKTKHGISQLRSQLLGFAAVKVHTNETSKQKESETTIKQQEKEASSKQKKSETSTKQKESEASAKQKKIETSSKQKESEASNKQKKNEGKQKKGESSSTSKKSKSEKKEKRSR